MQKYMVLYHVPASAAEIMAKMMADMTPEQTKAGMDLWVAWADKHKAAIVDLGMPLRSAKTVTANSVADGGSDTSGYSILQAEDVGSVVEMLKEHPHFHVPGGSIEVLESFELPGM